MQKYHGRNILVCEDGDGTLYRARAVAENIRFDFEEYLGPEGSFSVNVCSILGVTTYHALTPWAEQTFYLADSIRSLPHWLTIAKVPYWIGRGRGVDLSLCEHVSRGHAVLYMRQGKLHVRDLGSLNGTTVNGAGIQDADVGEADEVSFAEVKFYLQVERTGRDGMSRQYSCCLSAAFPMLGCNTLAMALDAA